MEKRQQLENIKNRVFNKKGKVLDLLDIYHIFMVNYGYIPFEDFISMDALIKDELLTRIIEMRSKK